MTDLVPHERRELAVPGLGSLVDLDDPAAVARALADVRLHKTMIDEARAVLERALVEESARAGTKTLRYGALTASVGPDTEVEWDVTELVKLRDLGLPEDRYAELVTEEVSYKVNGAVARQIAAANEGYARVIDRARVRRPRKQYVRVEGA